MSETNYGHSGNEGSAPARVHGDADGEQRPYWTRAHRDWRIWVALFFMFAAIAIYVLSDDLAFLPHLT
jgi:hypothetical protein